MILLFPLPEGICPQCGIFHEYHEPHQVNTVHYQVWFKRKHGRYPTAQDAVAHCSARTKLDWLKYLHESPSKILPQD